MASPFSVFRKNQKLMLAVLTILAMFGFVFLPILMDTMDTRAVRNPVVVETSKYGSLREYDVEMLRRQRQRILGALTDVMQMSGVAPMLARQFLESRIGPATEEAAVMNWLLARHAEKMGMVVSNESINAFLKELTRDSVPMNDFLTAFKRAGVSELQFFNAMREELLAMQLGNIFQVSLFPVTPAQRWEYFLRVKRSATIEAVPVQAADFIDKVAEPTDEELKSFFEEYKDQYAFPGSPEPGFREPQKVALQYFKADIDDFITPEMVTDAEVQERYEKNKDRYAEPVKKPEETEREEPKAEEGKESAPSDSAETPSPETSEAKPEASPSEPAAKPEEEKKPDGASAVHRESPFQLVSMLQEEKPSDEQPEKKPDSTSADDSPKAPVADKPAEDKPAAEEKPAEATPPADAAKESPPAAENGLTDALKSRIRREIAYEKINKIFDGLREKMDQYRDLQQQYKVEKLQSEAKGEKPAGPPPAPLDFDALAKDQKLTVGETGLISQWQAQDSEVGVSLVGGREPMGRYAFQSLSKFRPETSVDIEGNVYLFWKTDESKDHTPKFGDPGVREAVLRQWKMIQARKLALEKAETLAAEARKSGKFLKETFADQPNVKVIQPPSFSWMTFGNVPLGSAPNAARISTVPELDQVGNDFMRMVFQLEPNQVGVAMNSPKTVAYVVRLTSYSPSEELLWKEFEADDFSKYAAVGNADRQEMFRAWVDNIKTSAGLKWLRKPDQLPESHEGPAE